MPRKKKSDNKTQKTKKNIVIHKLPEFRKYPSDKIKGGDRMPDSYRIFNTFYILGKRGSGKTTCIYNLLKNIANPRSTIFIFSSNVNNDPSWKFIIDEFNQKGIAVVPHTSIYDDADPNINHIEAYSQLFSAQAEEKKRKKENPDFKPKLCIKVDEPELPNNVKIKKPKKKAPKYIFVLDDCSQFLRDPVISHFIKNCRHMKIALCCASQHYKDIKNDTRAQIDYWIMYPNIPIKNLNEFVDENGLDISVNHFKTLYKDATKPNKNEKKSHNFLFVDKNENKFYKNFNFEKPYYNPADDD